MFLQWVRIRSPCLTVLMSFINLFSSGDNPRLRVLRVREGSRGSNSSMESFCSSSRVFPWKRNSFFRTSTFFLSFFRLLFADDPNLVCAMVVTFFQFSEQQYFRLFYQEVHHVVHNLVFQHVGDFHRREDGPLGS